MIGFAGPASNFPVISVDRGATATADFLAAAITPAAVSALRRPAIETPDASATATIAEYDIPEPGDLPHDLALTSEGRVLITGMFTARMYVLDPATATFETVPIPVGNANPRAVEIDAAGDWWVVLGGPQRVARYDVSAGTWASWPVGMYAHSIGVDSAGRAWFNGHFTRKPEQIGYVLASGDIETYTVPEHPRAWEGFGPIPYELRIGPDGLVWMSELAGNRVHAFDPATATFRTFEMPTASSGPRRLDVAPDGIVWIPEYAAGKLARLDPRTGEFREFDLPMRDAAPYVARVDPRDGAVWLGTGMADALLRFDPATNRFTTWPLPTHGALVRHIAVAPNGDVWAAYGASPGIPGKVARLRVRAR
jgi:virginiamycin B lyase